MRVRCGWAEVVDPADHEVMGRGLLFVQHYPIPYPVPSWWDGHLNFLREYAAPGRLAPGIWLLRLYQGAEYCWVRIASIEAASAPSGERATAYVSSYDGDVPALLSELGGDG